MKRLLGISIVFLLAVVGMITTALPVNAMEQVTIGGNINNLNGTNGTNEYNVVMGGTTWSSTENTRWQTVPTGGTFSSMYIRLATAPDNGAGTQSYTFTLRVNGADSTLQVVISEASTTGSDLAHTVDVVAGDYVSLECLTTGTATVSPASWSLKFEGTTSGESISMVTAYFYKSGNYYASLQGAQYSSVDEYTYNAIPTDATIKSLYVKLNADPGSNPDAYRITYMDSGTASSLTCTITANDTTGNDTAHTVDVNSFDYGYFYIEPLNSPISTVNGGIGFVFLSDTDGESLIAGNEGSSTFGTNYYAAPVSWTTDDTTETNRLQLIQATTLQKLTIGRGSTATAYGWAEDGDGLTVRLSTADSSVTAQFDQPYVAVPTSDGSVLGTWTKSTGSTYWELVDDAPNGGGDYATLTALDAGEAYLTFPCSFSTSTNAHVNGLAVQIVLYQSSVASDDITAYIKVNGTYYTHSVDIDPSSLVYSTTYSAWSTNPDTGSAWTIADINGSGSNPLQEFGVRCTSLGADIRLTSIRCYPQVIVVLDAGATTDTATDGEVISMKSSGLTYAFWGMIGYISGWTADITESVTNKAFGVVAENTTYYAYGSAPSNPVVDGECTFTITNNGSACDLDMKMADFTGGVGWNIANSVGSNEVKITAYYSGQNPASGIVLTNADQEFYDGLAVSGTIKWDFKFETGTFTDGVAKSGVLTITAVAED